MHPDVQCSPTDNSQDTKQRNFHQEDWLKKMQYMQWVTPQAQKGERFGQLQRCAWTQRLSYGAKQVRKRKTSILCERVYVEPEKAGTGDLIYKAEVETHRENKYIGTEAERQGGMNRESGNDVYILLILCVK